jgi:hypothetical protein
LSGRPIDENFWRRLTRDVTRVTKKRTVLYALALTVGFIGLLLIGSASVLGRGSLNRTIVDLCAVVSVGLAILLRVWAERF